MALMRVSKAGGGASLTPEVLTLSGNTYTFDKAYSKVVMTASASIGLSGLNYTGSGTTVDSGSITGAGSSRYIELDNVSIGDTLQATASQAFSGWFCGWGFE